LARIVQEMAHARAIGCAEAVHDDAAMTRELAIEATFRLTLSGVDTPVEDPYVWAQVVDMPMVRRGAVQVAVHSRRQPAFGTAGIGIVAAWEESLPEPPDRNPLRGW